MKPPRNIMTLNLPFLMEFVVYLTNRCNLRCEMCSQYGENFKEKACPDLPVYEWKKFFDLFSGMLSSPNLQSPLILTHVSKSSVMTSSRRPSPPTTHMHTHTHTHINTHTYTHECTYTHTRVHTHTHIPVWDRVLSLSS